MTPYERDYSRPTYKQSKTISIANRQGFDIYNGMLFQFRANLSNLSNKMATANYNTGAIINTDIDVVSGHGDSASFSNQKYDPSDDYPLLYVSGDTVPYIYINRVTENSATLIKTIYISNEIAGYNFCGTYDWDNNIMYTTGTTENNWQSDLDGKNKCIVCKWDLTDMTDNGDGTFTPKLLSTYQRPFIYVVQGEQFHDGYIWLCSGYTNDTGHIYAMDPETGVFDYTLTMPTSAEIEGLSWQKRSNGVDYAIVGFGNGTFYDIIFN